MRNGLIVAGVMLVIGLVWMGQGTGVIPGTGFMNDDIRWAVIGLVVFLAGAALGARTVMRRPKA